MLRIWQEYVHEDDVLAQLSVLDENCQRGMKVIELLEASGGAPELQTHERACSMFTSSLIRSAAWQFPLALLKNSGRSQNLSKAITQSAFEASAESISRAASASLGAVVSNLCNNVSAGAAVGVIPNLRRSSAAVFSALFVGPTVSRFVGSVYATGLNAYYTCKLWFEELHQMETRSGIHSVVVD